MNEYKNSTETKNIDNTTDEAKNAITSDTNSFDLTQTEPSKSLSSRILSFEQTQKILRIKETTSFLFFNLSSIKPIIMDTIEYISSLFTSPENKIINTSDTLMFEIKTYDESVPIFQVVLDFIDVFGGIY